MPKIQKHTIILFILGLILCIPIILPYIHNGYFPSHDGEWAVVRAGEMFREIRDHQFPPRYSGVLNFGYGYPLFNFAYPFPYYLATMLHVLKFGFVDSIKFIFAGSVFLSFIGMFFLSSKFWKNSWAGFLSAVLYIYLPYHLVDLFVRGSIGESIAFALYPFLLFSCLFLLEKKHQGVSIVTIAPLTAILATTHNISAVYFGIIIGSYIVALLLARKNKEACMTILAFLWGGMISAFFLIPALLEKQYIRLSKIPIADRNLYFVTIQKILIPSWGYGTPTEANPFTYQLGIPQVLGFLSSCFVFFKTKSVEKSIVGVFVVLSCLFILMMFPVSSFLWKLPLLSEINYPWTLLLPLGFLMTFLSGSVIRLQFGKVAVIILAGAVVLLYVSVAKPSLYSNKGDSFYMTNVATTTSSNELMPLWVERDPLIMPAQKVEKGGKIEGLLTSSKLISFHVNLPKKGTVQANQVYYPGWRVWVDGQEQNISYMNKGGVMQIEIPKGDHQVDLRFTETRLRLIADIISVLSFVGLLYLAGNLILRKQHFLKKNQRRERN